MDDNIIHLFGEVGDEGGAVGDQVKLLVGLDFDKRLKAGFDEYELCHGFISEGLFQLFHLQGKDKTIVEIHAYAQVIGRGALDSKD